MCLAVFIASDRELSLLPFDPESPGFNIKAIAAREEPVRRQFSLPRVVYAGAHTSCGCGFRAESDEETDAAEKSRAALVEYIDKVLDAGSVQIFVCWEGHWATAPMRRLRLTGSALRESTEWLEELTFVEVVRGATEKEDRCEPSS